MRQMCASSNEMLSAPAVDGGCGIGGEDGGDAGAVAVAAGA